MTGISTVNLGRLSMNMHRSATGIEHSAGRLMNSGDAAESMRGQSGDGGGLTMVVPVGGRKPH